jgi:hypothetical protein
MGGERRGARSTQPLLLFGFAQGRLPARAAFSGANFSFTISKVTAIAFRPLDADGPCRSPSTSTGRLLPSLPSKQFVFIASGV